MALTTTTLELPPLSNSPFPNWFLFFQGGRKKKKTHVKVDPNAKTDVPKSFVLSSGAVNKGVRLLVRDFRQVMEPNTASRLKVGPPSRHYVQL